MTALLKVSGLRKAFGGLVAVDGIDFSVAAGEKVALIGPNGAGKTTCFNMLTGQLRPDAGNITVNGRDVTGMTPRRICRIGVARTFQVAAVFTSMTTAENVQLALAAAAGEAMSMTRALPDRHYRAACRLLARVGLEDQTASPAARLAYGDLKRLELAIALAGEPRLLLLDEPTAGMASGERAGIMGLVAAIVAEAGVSLLFTEHDMDTVFAHAERVMVLDRGRLIANGSPDEVRADATVRTVYLGDGRAYKDKRHARA